MAKYVILEEVNDNEGETWLFYLENKGNSEAIQILRNYCLKGAEEATDYDFPYQILENDAGLTEKQILKLQARFTGYLPEYNLVKGKLDVQKLKDADLDDDLYKGGIENFIIKRKR